jgi:hypothetical protein
MGKEASQEGLSQYADLARARALYIDLFTDASSLVNLGYTARQIAYTRPVLFLLEEEGSVATHIPDFPYFQFEDDEAVKSLEVYYLDRKNDGFRLQARRNDAMRWAETPEQILQATLFSSPFLNIFDENSMDVVDISLFSPEMPTDNIEYLINQLCKNYIEGKKSIKRKSPLNDALSKIGLIATYKAAWVDERTKHEFVAEIHDPVDDYSEYVAYRKLQVVNDNVGTMLPIGRKPNITQDKVTQVLTQRASQAIQGAIAWNPQV